MSYLYKGKVKDIHFVDDKTFRFRFSDRISAYDVQFRESIPKKGEVLCKLAEYWFNQLSVKHHFIERLNNTDILVHKMDMIPMECIVRGYYYGGLVGRIQNIELAAKLPFPLFDPTTKSGHDELVTKQQAIKLKLVTKEQHEWLSSTSIDIYNQMSEIVDKVGFILCDIKLEFGMLDGEIVLGDSIGLDECRLWPKDKYKVGQVQESYDKQILRDWLTDKGYKEKFDEDRAKGNPSVPPFLPDDLIETISNSYKIAYKQLTGYNLE